MTARALSDKKPPTSRRRHNRSTLFMRNNNVSEHGKDADIEVTDLG